MTRLSSIEDLKSLRNVVYDGSDKTKKRIVVCAGTACQASGSSDIIRMVKKHVIQNKLLDKVSLRVTGCHGFCEMGPFILTEPQNAFYTQVGLDDVPRIVDALISNTYVEELLYKDPKSGKIYFDRDEIPFFKNQKRSILDLNQRVDPIRIYDYIAQQGYAAFEEVLTKKDPKWAVDTVIKSGLRGRGGAGFSTGRKWGLLAAESSEGGKFLVCNADEGDPGAYMDRAILEGNPHSIIEGMLVGAYGTGATEGIVYVRAEYPLAIKHLLIALRQAKEHGLLGENILGTGFSFNINIVRGAGAFVCGEETALIKSIEGMMGEPRQRPPFPINKGVYGQPTAINNVETWANIPQIFRLGADKFAKIGTKGNSGTKIFSLVGKIKNTGLVEVPMGVSIGEVVFDIGGGTSGTGAVKAVQTGGPSGGCIPKDNFDLKIDYDTLAKAGSIMGSGGMIVMDDSTCMVDVAKYYMNFLKDESCGKCFPCRKGTQRMYEILDDVSKGEATLKDLDLLKELALAVKDSTMCGLGQTASNPVLSTLKYFIDEYKRHIVDKKCDAFVCKDLTGASCQSACPLGTEVWRYVAHISAGEFEEAYKVIREPNPFPSVCARVCNHPCESRCKAGDGDGGAIAIRTLKRFVTDSVDPSVFTPKRVKLSGKKKSKVAVVGAGPSGLAAAHHLSLKGYKVTVFETEAKPGGMLLSAIPEYRLPRDLLDKEIAGLIDDNVTLKCNQTLGKDITVEKLRKDFDAVYLALGAHRSRRLELDREDAEGVFPSIEFLKAFNLKGESKARGKVGVVGGGNSAFDAARVALRQKDVESVTILYRRTQDEMPAFPEEIEAAIEEGVIIQTLVSPTNILIKDGKVIGVKCQENQLGEYDSSGRRRPVPIKGSDKIIDLDNLIVAISEGGDLDFLESAKSSGVEVIKNGRIQIDDRTLHTGQDGVFAGGDVTTGPNTVVDSIAAGKKVAVMIERYLGGDILDQPSSRKVPNVYIEASEPAPEDAMRLVQPNLEISSRKCSFKEIELTPLEKDAICEAGRCLRCDLEFTKPVQESDSSTKEGRSA